MNSKTGVLLVNLGTPKSPSKKDVYKYLIEFLTDKRVIDLPWLKRQLVVRGLIVPLRYRQSAQQYQEIWTKDGSPLLIYGIKIKSALQDILGSPYQVELAMRYQEPSIEKGIAALMQKGIDHLIVLPLFPQYASATTGSVHQKVQEIISKLDLIPKLTLINQFSTHPTLIKAFCEVTRQHSPETYDHILFSFHGLPESHIRKTDKQGKCLSGSCCNQLNSRNKDCYAAQCHATARAIAEKLNLSESRFDVCFQSRLGKDPWLQPYTLTRIKQLGREGKKKLLVICPAFVCDCLETLYEMKVENAKEFQHSGGEKLELVSGLNDHPLWIQTLHELVMENSRR